MFSDRHCCVGEIGVVMKPKPFVTTTLDIDCAADEFRQLAEEWRAARGLLRNIPLAGDLLARTELPRPMWLMLWRLTEGDGELDAGLLSRVAAVSRMQQPMPLAMAEQLRLRSPFLQEIRVGKMPEPQRYQRLSLPLSDDGAEADWLLTFGLPVNPDLALWLNDPEGQGTSKAA